MIVVSLFGKVYNVEPKTSKDNKPYVVATIRDSVKNKKGEWEGRFIRLTAFGNTADNLKTCTKGTVACVEGVLEPSIYISKDGVPQLSLDVRVDRIRKVSASLDASPEVAITDNEDSHLGLDEPEEAAPPIVNSNPFAKSALV